MLKFAMMAMAMAMLGAVGVAVASVAVMKSQADRPLGPDEVNRALDASFDPTIRHVMAT